MGNKNTHVANVPGPDQTNKRVRTSGDVNDVNEEEDYRLMLEELANEKLSLFACEENNVLCEQVKEKKKSKKLKGGTKRKRSSRDGDCKKKKVKKVVGREIASKEATTQLKEFINEIMGSDMKLVIQKTLFQSDLKRSQNRLNMPFNQVETHDFLTDEEIRFLDRKADDAEIEVCLVGPNLQMFKKPIKDEQLCFAVVRVDEPVVNRTTLEEASSAGGSSLIS
ncbi:B3 domain-containing protein, DNA-binding pseudobarrel domain protein [Tanacetum coccineum]